MYDMGYKSELTEASSKQDETIRYPSAYLENNIPEELMNKEIGSKCRLEIEIEIKNKGINERDGKKRTNLGFDILKVGYIGKGGKLTKKEYLDKSEEEREDYNKKDLKIDEE